MKKYFTIITIFIASFTLQSQSITASISYTSGNTISVDFTLNGTFTTGDLTNLNLWIKLKDVTQTSSLITNSSILPLSLASGTNPSIHNSVAFGTGLMYRLTWVPSGAATSVNSLFTSNTINIGTFTINGPLPSGVELMVNTAPGNGTSMLVDGANYVSWPGGTGVRPLDVALPIHLQSFSAKKFAANTSLLEWITASEENASHIEIERSMDANTWTYIATEKARGSVNYKTDYSYVDAGAVLQRDKFTTVYYRLKLVDLDGKFEYSEVRSVTFDNNGIVSLEAYPNPTTEVINLRMAVGETNTNTAQMLMLDMSGKLVKKQTISANGISAVEVDQLETGIYNVIVKHEDKTYTKRIIKTN